MYKTVSPKITVFILLLLTLAGCSDKVDRQMPQPKSGYTLPVSTEIQGRLKNYLKIPKQEIEIKIEIDTASLGMNYKMLTELNVDFIRSKTFDSDLDKRIYQPSLELALLDKFGQKVINISYSGSQDEFLKMLSKADGMNKLQFSNTSSMYFDFKGEGTKDDLKDAFSYLYDLEQADRSVVVSYFKKQGNVNSTATFQGETYSSETYQSGNEQKRNKSSNESDCDTFLRGYKNYVENYVRLLKEQQKNPSSTEILTKASKYAAEANQWASKAESCKDDPEFLEKYTRVQMELTRSLQNIN